MTDLRYLPKLKNALLFALACLILRLIGLVPLLLLIGALVELP